MTSTYRFSREYVLYELSAAEGWSWMAWAAENNAWSNVERESDGYVGQEIDRLNRVSH